MAKEETHPAFGLASIGRISGSPRALFQSDLMHNETIRLSISRADRSRDLNYDWTHATTELIEVEMSLAQWGALISSGGIGSGVPVTIRSTESEHRVPEVPHEPRMKQNLAEVAGTVAELFSASRKSFEALLEAIEEKKGAKAIREALRHHQAMLENAPSNAKFAVNSLARAAESVVSQARADIESSVIMAARLTGTSPSIEGQSFLAIDEK